MPAISDSQTFRERVYDMKVLFSKPVALGLLSTKALNCNSSFSPFSREVLLGKTKPKKNFP